MYRQMFKLNLLLILPKTTLDYSLQMFAKLWSASSASNQAGERPLNNLGNHVGALVNNVATRNQAGTINLCANQVEALASNVASQAGSLI